MGKGQGGTGGKQKRLARLTAEKSRDSSRCTQPTPKLPSNPRPLSLTDQVLSGVKQFVESSSIQEIKADFRTPASVSILPRRPSLIWVTDSPRTVVASTLTTDKSAVTRTRANVPGALHQKRRISLGGGRSCVVLVPAWQDCG
jgi:hypothetical protein